MIDNEQELESGDYYAGDIDVSQDWSVDSTDSTEDAKEKFKKMIHKILGVSESSRQVEKICCFFRINRKYSVTSQLTYEYSLFLSLVMAALVAGAIFFVKFSPEFVGDSILDVIDSSIQQSYQNSLLEYNTQVAQYLKAYRSLIVLSIEVFSASAGWHTSLYELASQMPLESQGKYISSYQPLPYDLIDPVYSGTKYYNQPISLETFCYLANHSDDAVGISVQSKAMLDSSDILSYFFKSFFFQPQISNIFSLYLYIEERDLVTYFPAGGLALSVGTKIDIKTRPWYINTVAAFKSSKSPNFIISGPYFDLTSGLKILTYSLPIVKESDTSTVAGIMSVDIIVNQFSSVYDTIQTSEDNINIAFIDLNSNLIINNCFNSAQLITFYQTNVTGFSFENWNDIKNTTKYSISSTFIITNALGIKYYIARSITVGQLQNNHSYMLIVFGKQTSYQNYRSSVDQRIQESLYDHIVSLLISLSIIWFLGYFFIFLLARHIVKPLSKLSSLAKGVYKNNDKKRSQDDLKDSLSKIQGSDEDMNRLIESFINLVDQHSGIRKRAINPQSQNDTLFPVFGRFNDYLLYPYNYKKEDFEPLKQEVRKLKNLDKEQECNGLIDQTNQDLIQVKSAFSERKISQNQDHSLDQDNSENETEIFNEVSQSGLSEHDDCFKDEYYYRLKQKILEIKDNPIPKRYLSQQILTEYLPKSTQPI